MQRQLLWRSLRRSQQVARLNALQAQQQQTQNFSSSARQQADVELTVDGQKVTVPGKKTQELSGGGRHC